MAGGTGSYEFLTLGQLALVRHPDGARVGASQRRKLVVLAYLALASRPVSRDTLVELFWGDEDEERARHSLSNALSFLRGVLGPDAIAARKSDVALGNRSALRVDALELAAAARAMQHDRVLALYRGPFLDAVHVRDSASFDSWVEGERARLESLFTASCGAACTTAAAASEWQRCTEVARRWLEIAPRSSDAALHLLHSLRAVRTPQHRREALAEYDRLRIRLAREWNAEPHPHVVEIARRIRERAEADEAAAAAIVVAAEPDPELSGDSREQPPVPAPLVDDGGPPAPAAPAYVAAAPDAAPAVGRSRLVRPVLLGGALAAAVAGILLLVRPVPATASRNRALIAVTDIANVRGDTAASWLEDGLAQLIASDLARNATVEVVTPDRIRETRRRERLPASGPLDERTALDVASRLGASLAVRGGFTRGADGYLLDLTLRDVATARDIGTVTVSGADPTALADHATARLLQWSISGDTQPRYADVEAPNIVAYQHFIRSLQARDEGRFTDSRRELDAALAIDSAFGSALSERAETARSDGDTLLLARLGATMRRAHFSRWDQAVAVLDSAQHNGEAARSEALARGLVEMFPHDPRSWSRLAGLYQSRGAWASAERTMERQLSLDSLAVEAGTGPCVPCAAYRGLVEIHLMRGDLPAAEQAARRWLTLQPDLPAAWANLGEVLEAQRQHAPALEADRRALGLSGDDPTYRLILARAMLMAGQPDAADSLLGSVKETDPRNRETRHDIHVLSLREQGRYRESVRVSEQYLRSGDGNGALLYEELDALGRLGEYAAARQLFATRIAPASRTRAMPATPRGDAARWFAWSRALEASALGESADTLLLRALADSLEAIGPRSYYGRDWRLSHHVRGLLAMLAHRPGAAAVEFEQARWGVAGWTGNLAWLGRAQLAAGRPDLALAALRRGYESPLDAMGRYVPRTELDYLMSMAFRQAGMADSAAVYASRVRHAWRGADAGVRRRLDAL